MWVTALSHRIKNVIHLGPKKQMLWIYAAAIIAMMTNALPLWNWTISYFPCEPTGFYHFAPEIKLATARVNDTSHPNPASIRSRRYIYFLPKPLDIVSGNIPHAKVLLPITVQ